MQYYIEVGRIIRAIQKTCDRLSREISDFTIFRTLRESLAVAVALNAHSNLWRRTIATTTAAIQPLRHRTLATQPHSAGSARLFPASVRKVPLRDGPLGWEKDLSPIWRLWDGSWCVIPAASWWAWWGA